MSVRPLELEKQETSHQFRLQNLLVSNGVDQ